MKKILFTLCCIGTLASCNVKNSDEYKTMKAERDSLLQENAEGSAELADMMGIINEVEENFSKIKETEKYLTLESKNKNEMSRNTKTRVRDNFQMINDIIAKNKAEIKKLNQRLNSSNANLSSLKTTIQRLNNELEERTKIVEELRTALSTRDAQIATLTGNVEALSGDVEKLTTQAEAQAAVLAAQERALNAGYYIFGTSKELKDAKVVKGRFLASPEILKEGITKSKFIEIDIRNISEIPVFSKKAKLLSDHPKDSYKIEKDSEGKATVKITNYEKFWSLTRFLIIEV